MHPRAGAAGGQSISENIENIIQMKFRQQDARPAASSRQYKLELKYSKYTVQHVSPSLISPNHLLFKYLVK